jgi:hypothetical protein
VRATASMSLMIGVAAATSLIVAGILAGPALLDCNRAPGGIAACLRAKVDATGLLPEAPKGAAPPLASAIAPPGSPGWIDVNATELASSQNAVAALSAGEGAVIGSSAATTPGPVVEIALTAPDTFVDGGTAAPSITGSIDVALAAPTGNLDTAPVADPAEPPLAIDMSAARNLIDASAASTAPNSPDLAELSPRVGNLNASSASAGVDAPAATELRGLPGALAAEGIPPSATPLTATLDASPATGQVSTTLAIDGRDAMTGGASLSSSAASVDAGATSQPAAAPPSLELSPPLGSLLVEADPWSAPLTAALETSPALGEVTASGEATDPQTEAVAALNADPPISPASSLLPPLSTPVEPPLLPLASPVIAAIADPPPADPPKPASRPVLIDDPQYPNVLTLPPPALGSNSSVVLLQLK